jgi:FkbM family methyltransferase
MLNDRSIWLIARNVARPVNYLALARLGRVYDRPLAAAARYFFGSGEYPITVRVRTPIGIRPVTLYNGQDAITLHEIFCREDYRCPSPPKIVVDLGSNIGISALYFLTRSPETFCELYEPDPHNVSKLLTNLENFNGRFTLHEVAVADREGFFPFSRESTGRYGRIDAHAEGPDELGSSEGANDTQGSPEVRRERILVRVNHVNTVLDEAISRHGVVDLLKIDTEGSELATVMSIDRELLSRVRHIVIEWFDAGVKLNGFSASSSCDTIMFSNMATVGLPR